MHSEVVGNYGVGSSNKLAVRIPFVNTNFSTDLRFYLVLWPLWWLLGIEQLALPIFVSWETLKLLFQSRGYFRLSPPIMWAFGLAVWWIVPIVHIDRLDLFLKDASTIWVQALFLLLGLNCLRTYKDWEQVARGLIVFAAYIAAGSLIYLLGIWRGSFLSFLGQVLPNSLIDSSAFFSSIALRDFGTITSSGGLLNNYRLSSFALQSSALSMICLALIPFVTWKALYSKGFRRIALSTIFIGLLLSLIFAESRIAFVGFGIGLLLLIILGLDFLKGRNFPLFSTLVALLGGLLLIGATFVAEEILDLSYTMAYEWRPGSALVRLMIYQETLRLLPEHPIIGWGLPVRIPGVSSVYSAGTHSSYLGMLFQHGIVGLVFYIGIWFSLWRIALKNFKKRAVSRRYHYFWLAMIVAFAAFNVREVADTWWWDQTLTITIWTVWILALTAGHLLPEQPEPSG